MLYDKSRDNVIPSVLQLVTNLQLTSTSFSSAGIDNRRGFHMGSFLSKNDYFISHLRFLTLITRYNEIGWSKVLIKSFDSKPIVKILFFGPIIRSNLATFLPNQLQ